MTSSLPAKSSIAYHNKTQLQYFAKRIKKTMIPVDSSYVNNHIEQTLRFASIGNDQKILEVGCGMGKYTLNLLMKGLNVEALDLSPFLLQQLLRYSNNRFNLKLYACDVLDAPDLVKEKFDIVLGFFTLHHLHNLTLSFRAMKEVLSDGGKIVFLEPNPYNPLYYLQIALVPGMSWKGEKGIAEMRRSSFERAAAAAGFTRVRIKKFGFFPPFIKNTAAGNAIENVLERISILEPVRPFQIVEIS